MLACVTDVAAKPEALGPAREIGRSLAGELELADPDRLRAQVPPGTNPALVEAQSALTWGSAEYRLEGRRKEFAQALGALTADQLKQAAGKYLRKERCASVELVHAK